MNGSDISKKLNDLWVPAVARLKTISGDLWKALSFSPAETLLLPERVLSVSLEEGCLQVAYGSRFLSAITIHGVRTYTTGEGYTQPDSLASSVALAAADFGVSGLDVTLCIPKSWAVIRTVDLPSTVRDNLREVIAYELDRFTPFSSGEAVYDFTLLRENVARITVALAAARADKISPFVNALAENGFSVKRVAVDLSCIGALCAFAEGMSDMVFFEAAGNGYEIAVYSGGCLVSSGSGSFRTADVQSMAVELATELKRYLDLIGQPGGSPQVVGHFRDTHPGLKDALRLQTPYRLIGELKSGLKYAAGQYAYLRVAGGALETLWPKAKGLDLLRKGTSERRKTPFFMTTLLAITILCLAFFYLAAPIRLEEKRIGEIDKQISLKKAEARKVEALKEEIETLKDDLAVIDDFSATDRTVLDVLKELTNRLPSSVWLTRVKITAANVDIEGYSSSATEIISKVEASKYFKKAEFASPTFRDTRMNADRFSIKMEIEGLEDSEPKAVTDARKK